jgi:Repeat of unknown function (DUF346)
MNPSTSRRAVLGLLGAGLTAAAVPMIPGRETASAAPPAPDFGPAIDPYAGNVGQSTCSPTPKPGVVDFMNLVLAEYPETTSFGIVRDCNIGNASEHKEGRAWDWGVSATSQAHIAGDLLNWLLATDRHGNPHALLRRFGIMYMIWNRQIWKSYQAGAGWQDYDGENPHTDHVHFSFSWEGANKQTTWWTGAPPPPPPPPSARRGGPSGFAAAWAPDRLDVFGRGGGGVPYHNHFDRAAGAGFPDWHSLAGATGMLSKPTVVSQYNGRLDVFAVGSDRLMRQWWFDRLGDNRWRGPGTLGTTTFAGPPSAVSFEPGRIDLFARDTNDNLRHAYYQHGVTGGFTAWETLGSHLLGDPVAVSWSAVRWDVFAVRDDNLMWHWFFDRQGDGEWHGAERLGLTTFLGTPAAVSWDHGRLDVFGRDTNNNLRHAYFQRGDTTQFTAWETLGDGGLDSSPTVVSQYNGRLDVFYVHRVNKKMRQLYFDRLGDGEWHGPGQLGETTFTDTFDAVSWAPGRIDLFGVDTNNHMRHSYFQHGDTTGFTAWENLAGTFT